MEAVSDRQPTSVLTSDAVRWAIDALKQQRIHPFFLAYLHLRKRAREEGTTTEIHPRWDELSEHLRMRGGPPNKPHFRPVWDGQTEDPGRYWLNENLAGSYAPSSLRRRPYTVVDTEGSSFSLKRGHALLARENLLFDRPVSAIAFAAFYFRDFGFVNGGERLPGAIDLAGLLGAELHFEPGEPDFDLLFTTNVPPDVSRWFEPLDDETTGLV